MTNKEIKYKLRVEANALSLKPSRMRKSTIKANPLNLKQGTLKKMKKKMKKSNKSRITYK